MKEERPKKDVLLRLKKIEGQLRGLQRMVEQGVPCPDVMNQVAAVISAVKKVGIVMVQGYMEECLNRTGKKSGPERTESLKDLRSAISQFIEWS
jgi:CsoR family transcriptional regulator, copper-sensing transcriptional repressor